MTHVVERCPSCGVEHEWTTGGECEACHTPLRPWCRRHGRDIGWLDRPACPRCTEEAARPRPARPPRPAPAAAKPASPPRTPAVSAPERAAPPSRPEPSLWPGGRSPREILRGAPRVRRGEAIGPARPPRSGLALLDTLGFSISGAVAGILAGFLFAPMVRVEPAAGARVGATLFGLAGLVVGLIRALALRLAEQDRDEYD